MNFILKISGQFLLALIPFALFGQHGTNPSGHTHSKEGDQAKDTTAHCLKECFTKGHVFGNVRNYSMATLNEGILTDYYANAIGGSLGYHTAEVKGVSLGIKGIIIYQVPRVPIQKYDSLGGGHAKYELQLFDIEHPENHKELDRLEELYLQYRYRKSTLKFGKQDIFTPLVNRQDTRMKPYVISGLWGQFLELPRTRINAGWFFGTSPRSTTQWYTIEEAIGIYSNGHAVNGEAANYRGHVETSGIGIVGITHKPTPSLTLQLWDYFLEGVKNTTFFQADLNRKNWVAGVQLLRQDALKSSEKDSLHHEYFHPEHSPMLVSLRLGRETKKWEATANFTRISKGGRFIFPRELGREQFYSTIARGRLEGLGDATALIFRTAVRPAKGFQAGIDFGRVYTPGDGTDYELNKYGTVSYDQFNLDLNYAFDHILKGLELRFLYVYKRNLKDYPGRYDLVFNKSNFHHFNLMMNLDF